MAVIFSYPIKSTPDNDDLILISDGTDKLTKQVRVSSLPGGSSGVTSLNTLTQAVTITGGTNVTLNTVGNNIEINAAGGGGTPSAPLNSVQFNNNSAFGGSANLTFATDTLRVTHNLDVRGDGTNAGKLKLYCENTTTPHAVTIEGPAHSGATAYTLKLPSPAPTSNQVLEYENSTNNLRWINTPSGGGSTSPASPLNSVQFNNNGSFGGSSNFTYTNSTRILSIGDQDVLGGIVDIAGGQTGGAGQLRLGDDGTSGNYITLKGAADVGNPYNIVLPGGAPGGANKILESDASGNLTWINTPTASGISFSGSTANGIATYSSASIANVSSNLTIDNTNKKLNIGSTYSIQDSSAVFKIGSLSSSQAQESIEFHINGAQKVKVNEDGRLVASVGSAANPNLKLGTGNDGIYGTTNTVQLITNGTSKISISDGNTADIQMNDLVEFGSGLRFGATGETLSSYEEGTWTPAPWVYSGTAPTVVSANGTYTIIGDICHITFQIVVTGSSSSSAAMILNGLPTIAQGDATNGEQSAGQLFVNTDSNTYDGVPSMFYVAGDKLTMVVQGGSKNSLTSPYGLKAQDYVASWYRPTSGSGTTLKGSATYKLL